MTLNLLVPHIFSTTSHPKKTGSSNGDDDDDLDNAEPKMPVVVGGRRGSDFG